MAFAAMLSGCHIYKPYKRPDMDTSGLYRDTKSVTDTMATEEGPAFASIPYEEVFTDPALKALIAEGLEKSVDMRAAILRVEEARTLLTAAHLSFLPSLTLAPRGEVSSLDGSTPARTYTLPAVASWEVDLFGKLLNADRGQRASLLLSQEARQTVRVKLINGIATAYYSLLMLDRQAEVTEANRNLMAETVRTMKAMKEAGMTNEAAVARTSGALRQINASLEKLYKTRRETENSLSVLLDRTPGHIERSTLDNQHLPELYKAGVPLALLENRPDIRLAEAKLASAYYRTNQARSAFYPNIKLTATGGWTNGANGRVIQNPAVTLWNVVGQLTQPIFAHGKIVANLKVSKREEEIARMEYRRAMLDAGREVSDALYAIGAADRRLEQNTLRADELSRAVEATAALFEAGKASYLEVITSRQALLSAQMDEAADRFEQLRSTVSLYSALGGGREKEAAL